MTRSAIAFSLLASLVAGTAQAEKVLAKVKVNARGRSLTTYGALVPHPNDRGEAHKEAVEQLTAEGERLKLGTPGATRFELKITAVTHGAESIYQQFFKRDDRYATADITGKVIVYGN